MWEVSFIGAYYFYMDFQHLEFYSKFYELRTLKLLFVALETMICQGYMANI